MATNKVFVSPGVYTSERDLSFVSQSVGVTTLGIVGEALKGPAFEPIFITNFDEYQAYFGGTVPEKFVNTQIPKYEAAYIAKSYLQQSNQLFVTRILGLSGYDAGPSWSIVTVANVNPSTIELDGEPTLYTMEFSGTTGGSQTIVFLDSWPAGINVGPYTTFEGGTSSISGDAQEFLFDIIQNNALSADSINYWGSIDTDDYDTLVLTYTAETNSFGVDNVSFELNDLENDVNDPWYYALFNSSGTAYTGDALYTVVDSLEDLGSGDFSGVMSGYVYTYSGQSYVEYDDMVVATLRSRGLATYGSDTGAVYQVSGTSDMIFDCSSIQTYSEVQQNPFATFNVSGVTIQNKNFNFEVSMSVTAQNFVGRVLGRGNFTKDRNSVPVFVEEVFPSLLNYAYNQGYIRGLDCNFVTTESARSETVNSIGWYLEKYQSAESPWVVSQLRGNEVDRLFKVITISDGDSANVDVKISVQNISFNNGTFDLVVRDYYDTDSNIVVLEKFTTCTMNPGENSYVGKKVGSSDGEYALNSKYIMLELDENAPVDSLPCGFEGFIMRDYDTSTPPFPIYKTKYDFPGEQIFNPPFGGSATADNNVLSSGDKIRPTYLGISSFWGWDPDFFAYKGKQNPVTNFCNALTANNWAYKTKGFHMDSGATNVLISDAYQTSGTSAFEVGSAPFQGEPSSTSPYYTIQSRKFTFLCQGGFDGWDIYREYRTNGDQFRIGGSGFLKGYCGSDPRYPLATGQGTFKLTSFDGIEMATTDYYAYLLGQLTFNNPEAININVFTTPGIDFVNNGNLVEDAIEMIEQQRADSIYIMTSPDVNLFLPTVTADDIITPTELVDTLSNSGIDSNYTATYYPWILVRDTVNNTQIYIPSTGEVCRNLALTDNIAFPWFASAGYSRGLVNSVKARLKLTQAQRDTLYEGRLNPIATFADIGTVIWGNKTLQIRESALDRINVRRLLLQTRKLISAVAVRLLFEQNDEKVRNDFLDAVNPILDAIRRDRGLYDFRVTVSFSPEDLDRNQMTGKIYLKPTKSLEFIDIEFLITPTGASFEDI